MIKRILKNILLYTCLLLLTGLIFYIYDTCFGIPRWEWPTLFLSIIIIIDLILFNLIGFITSMILFNKKRDIIIGYIFFIIFFIIYILYTNIKFSDVNGGIVYMISVIIENIFSLIITILILVLEKVYIKYYLGRIIILNDELFKKKIMKIKKSDLELFINECSKKDIVNKYYTRIEQIFGKKYEDFIKDC